MKNLRAAARCVLSSCLINSSSPYEEEHVVGERLTACTCHPCAIAKPIAVLVGALRFLVAEIKRRHAQLRQRVQLVRLTAAVVIYILPQPQRAKDRVVAVNHAIAVAAPCRLVILSQSKETVRRRRSGLRREVAK